MKFQRYLQDAQRNSGLLRHLDYKALKAQIKQLAEAVQTGAISSDSAARTFARRLEAELTEVGCSWEMSLWRLRDMMNGLVSTSDMRLSETARGAFCSVLGPLKLLDPLQEWIPVAALADALRHHRLLQMTAVVKIEKKFVKVVGVQLKPDYRSAELLRRSALSSNLIHNISARLEAICDTLLELGLGGLNTECKDACSICLSELVDPARLPCSHRFCVHCVLPLFPPVDISEADLDAVHLRCPLCRAAGPAGPQALCLDGLLARLERGMSQDLRLDGDQDSKAENPQRFTAVVVSSLARLASWSASSDEPLSSSSVLNSKSIILADVPACKPMQGGIDASHDEES
eukprot:TRINITY_DN34253_c0_g1_i1.p1 TRINITY_DN34253_c0_g1~~TRINITY_DN34253_c0_g1_i1.p1  ORF type:complete len:346 (+),score=50.19 TRINITY_DN34253_c0_g1_i1:34-1071(+)